MSELIQPAEEQTRQMIRTWLTAQNRSLRNLAQEAGIPPSVISKFLRGETKMEANSALKLYGVMQHSLAPLERRAFIEATGLLPLASAFSHDLIFTVDLNASPFEVGNRLILTAIEYGRKGGFTEAIPLLRNAEQVLGVGSNLAAYAACQIGHTYILIGDYRQAQAEALRIQATYGAILDPETTAEFQRLQLWLAYYLGDYLQSEHWLKIRMQLGKQTGIERFTDPHFLGRTYFEIGQLVPRKRDADRYFAKAVQCFERSYQLNLRWGNELDRAYDWFRKAQVLQAQRQWSDAQALRKQAGHIFRTERSVAILHVELEEAKLALLEGDHHIAQAKAEAVLHGWIQFNYTKGVGDALKVLGEVAYVQRQVEQAFEIFATRLCVFPFDTHPSTGQIWEEMNHLQANWHDEKAEHPISMCCGILKKWQQTVKGLSPTLTNLRLIAVRMLRTYSSDYDHFTLNQHRHRKRTIAVTDSIAVTRIGSNRQNRSTSHERGAGTPHASRPAWGVLTLQSCNLYLFCLQAP
jgi:tetratricopeptide (TPR) repeat protein